MTVDADAFREFERRTHDRIAESYRVFFEPVTAGAIEALLDGARVGPGRRVLDVASGPGAVAAASAARGAVAVAVDLSPQMVALARTRHPHLDVREADAERLPFAAGSFDAVVCNFGLGHFPRPELVAAELLRVLAPGGHAALSWWDAPARSRVNGVFLEAVAEVGAPPPASVPPGPPITRFADDAELRALLTIAGFQDASVRTVAWSHDIPSVDAWWEGGLGSLARAAALIIGQPAEVQARIRAAFERLAGAYRGAHGFSVPLSAKVAAGTRT